MGLIREPKNVDFTVHSKPWTEKELRDFRKLMTELKSRNEIHEFNKKKMKVMSKTKNVKQKMRGLTTRKKVIV